MKKQTNNMWVSPTQNHQWKAQKENSERASKVFETKKEAEAYSRQVLNNTPGGGELISQKLNGQIGSKDTINRKDYIPPKDTEH